MLSQEDKLWAASGHLSYVLGLPIIFPVILYLWKKDSAPFVADQAKQAIGLHLVTVIVSVLAVAFSFATFGIGILAAVPFLMLFATAAFVFSVVAALKISDGQSYQYPLFGEWIDRL